MRAAACELNGLSGHEAGRKLLARLYREETGEDLPEIRITSRGKPYFSNSPLHFSISHTENYAFCILSDCPVGIDAEEAGRSIRPCMLERALSRTEQLRVAEAPDASEAFLALWVLKEAAVKMTGEGLQGFPNQTDFSPSDPRIRRWKSCIVAWITEEPREETEIYAV